MVEHLVYCNTSLLYGRHLDQLLLAAMYGVCKVHGLKQVTGPDLNLWFHVSNYNR